MSTCTVRIRHEENVMLRWRRNIILYVCRSQFTFFYSSKYGLRPARTAATTSRHLTSFSIQCAHNCTSRDRRHRPTAAAQTTTTAPARRWRCCHRLLPLWRARRCCAGARSMLAGCCACQLHCCSTCSSPAASSIGTALGLWLWLRLRATAAAAPHARRRPRRGSSPSSLASWDSARPGLEPGPSRERKFI